MSQVLGRAVGLRRERAVRLQQGKNLATHGEGRHCRADGCATVLSRYNPDPVCGAHGGWHPAGQGRRRQSPVRGNAETGRD